MVNRERHIMKKTILAIALATSMGANAIGSETKNTDVQNEMDKTDVLIGASAGTGLLAGFASWALPSALVHSSGGAILYSGAGYVAGTMGLAAGTVASLPFIAAGAAVVGTGAVVYKYYGDDIAEKIEELTEDK